MIRSGPSRLALAAGPWLAAWLVLAPPIAAPAHAAVTLIGPWAEARGATIRVSWQTATELDHAGFLVQRGPRPEGPFESIDASWQPARGVGHGGADYAWIDSAVVAGVDYYYRIEAVGNQNDSEYFGPVCARLGAAACGEAATRPSETAVDPTPDPAPSATPTGAGPTAVVVATLRSGAAQPAPERPSRTPAPRPARPASVRQPARRRGRRPGPRQPRRAGRAT
ncbi:MAG: hypothetical protein H6648_08460 [Caldilineae bacterium]|nr:hypothetical protein [Caldilineae bacterium]